MIPRGKTLDGFEGHLNERRDHDDGEDEDPQRLQPSTADWVAVLVLLANEPGGDPDDGGRQEVQHGVYQAGQDGYRGHRDDDGNLSGQQDGIGGKVDVDGQGHDGSSTVDIIVLKPGDLRRGLVDDAVPLWQCTTRPSNSSSVLVTVNGVLKQGSGLGGAIYILGGSFHFLGTDAGASEIVDVVAVVAGRRRPRRLLGYGGGHLNTPKGPGGHVVVLVEQIMRQRRVQQPVDIKILLNQIVGALIV